MLAGDKRKNNNNENNNSKKNNNINNNNHNNNNNNNNNKLNDLIWRAVKMAQISATKEPIGLSRIDGKRPDGATLIP